MAISTRKLKKGEYVVHHKYGVGQVRSIDKKTLNGKKKSLYRIKTPEMTFWLPVKEDHTRVIRKVSAPSTFRSTLFLIRKKPKKIAKHHRSRKKKIKNRAMDLSLTKKARIMRDLYGRQVRKNLNFQDQMTLEKLKRQFVREWAVSAEIDHDEALHKLEDALITSASKLE